ncbi:DUF1467 family protein [Nitratireductor alexandrii]|uniref:DUF1467 family protein n=1 Tax=Nitratireductor alexandrii TaxID=2448161 RepID=UPI000FD939A3|nr:DUF1467 family protein [Nitratireductor alexandrii]
MSWVSGFAVYFIIWWVTLFVVMPFGLKTQEEDGDVTLGTTASAPKGPHMRRAALRATLISLLVFALLYVLTRQLGYSFEDIPSFIPDFQ